ncbi:hypothetical protein ACFFWB_18430 [Flavobacterium procerum]|uniref:hypothetical protein n=1 Tax=Flavobacterium procerum TaxID=1455569 RepID=UPI0035EB36F7
MVFLTNYAVFRYKEGGKVEEYNDFRIGRDSYIVNDGIMNFKDIMTGETKFADMGGSDAASTSHTFDILGNYDLANDWKFKFSTRFRYAKASQLIAIPLGVFQDTAGDNFTYKSNGNAYVGNVNSMLGLYTDGVPTKTALSDLKSLKMWKNTNGDLV